MTYRPVVIQQIRALTALTVLVAILTTPLPVAAAGNKQEAEQSWTADMTKGSLAIKQLRARDAEPLLKHSLATAETIDDLHKYFSIAMLGFCSYKMQDLDAAESYCQQALKLVSEHFSKGASMELAQSITYKLLSIISKERRDNSNYEKYNAESQKQADALDRERLKCPEYYSDVIGAVLERWKLKRRDSTTLPMVRFAVGSDGAVQLIYLPASSGDQSIDDIALNAVTSIGKFKPPPASAPNPLFFTILLNPQPETWSDQEVRLKANLNRMETDANVPLVERINTFGECGNLCMSKGDFSSAESYFAKALELTDQLPIKEQSVAKLYWMFAICRERQKKFSEADDYLVKAIAITKSRLPEATQFYIEMLKARANILSVMGRSEELVNCLNEINSIKKEPVAASPATPP